MSTPGHRTVLSSLSCTKMTSTAFATSHSRSTLAVPCHPSDHCSLPMGRKSVLVPTLWTEQTCVLATIYDVLYVPVVEPDRWEWRQTARVTVMWRMKLECQMAGTQSRRRLPFVRGAQPASVETKASAELLSVPPRHQSGDGSTKREAGAFLRKALTSGTTRLHEESARTTRRQGVDRDNKRRPWEQDGRNTCSRYLEICSINAATFGSDDPSCVENC